MNPQILDTARRVARTVVQVALAFGSVAAVYPLIVNAIGAPAGSNAAIWLAAVGTWVTTAAGIISRVMAIPAVNTVLGKVLLAGHSGVTAPITYQEPSTATQLQAVITAGGGEFTSTSAR